MTTAVVLLLAAVALSMTAGMVLAVVWAAGQPVLYAHVHAIHEEENVT